MYWRRVQLLKSLSRNTSYLETQCPQKKKSIYIYRYSFLYIGMALPKDIFCNNFWHDKMDFALYIVGLTADMPHCKKSGEMVKDGSCKTIPHNPARMLGHWHWQIQHMIKQRGKIPEPTDTTSTGSNVQSFNANIKDTVQRLPITQ